MTGLEDFIISIVIIGITAISMSRAILAPQKLFARVTFLSIAVAFLGLKCSVQQGDILSWIGVISLIFGMIVGIFMIWVEIVWIVRKGKMTNS